MIIHCQLNIYRIGSLKMENQKQCGCCSCRCYRLEKELIEQRELKEKYKKIAKDIYHINRSFEDLYENIMNDTQDLGSCIEQAENELVRIIELEEKQEQEKTA